MKKLPRMTDWLVAALLLSVLALAFSPQQLPVSLYKLNLIAIAGVVGYWLDRSLFPYARPDSFMAIDLETIEQTQEVEDPPLQFKLEKFLQNDLLVAASMLRRAFIVSAAMIAVGLGA
ncbi:putative holin [Undibacterium sp.]|uniref:putative holin n=1 Tax=Undibacterium sp. TaxID=1914977 RepID=UPI0027311CA2|nr:putative holin [Undibacterium sp.]MDP1980494.1 putative holin [Undibacterium sp.]